MKFLENRDELLKNSMSKQIQSNNALIISASPHMYDAESIPRIMWAVVFSLVPAGIAGVFTFGYYGFCVAEKTSH